MPQFSTAELRVFNGLPLRKYGNIKKAPGGLLDPEDGKEDDSVHNDYTEFLKKKKKSHIPSGFNASTSHLPMFDFQHHVVNWSCQAGKACVFAGTGLGKTRMQVAYADQVAAQSGGSVLILSPLAVAGQTIQEASVMGLDVSRANGSRIQIANYEQLHNIESTFSGVVLDESSILKSHDGAYRKYITDRFSKTPYRLALTATPAPNDYMELGTHAEFVGVMTRLEMLATYFTHDGGDTSKWRLKKHARRDFWQWVSTWAMCFNNPSDIGFDGAKYILPELVIHEHIMPTDNDGLGGLFGEAMGVSATEIHKTQRHSSEVRLNRACEIEAESDDPIILWCSTNAEQDSLKKMIPHAVSISGNDSPEYKEKMLLGFANGEFKTVITKPSIAGFGMNWQRCNRMVFVSISYSFEMLYQSIRRCYRFGQSRDVHAHLLYSESEDGIRQSLRFKSDAHNSMLDEMRAYSN